MEAIVQRDSFYFDPTKSKAPLDVFETNHNILPGQWHTFTLETGRNGAKCVVSFNSQFRHSSEWKERIGPVFVQRNKNGLVSAVKREL